MENGIEEILKEHEALCSRVFHLLNTGNPQTKDIELIIPNKLLHSNITAC